jgi:adenylate cyclase
VFENKLVRGFLIGLAGAILALIPHAMGYMEPWEAKAWDWRAKLMAKPGKATHEIRLILLDQKSLEWGRQESAVSWPWPKEMYSAVVSFCRRNGVKALAFDVLFEDPSGYGTEDDRKFGRALAALGHVATAVSLDDGDGPGAHWPEDIPLPKFKTTGLDQWRVHAESKSNSFKRAKMPIVEVAQNIGILGNVTQSPDPDGVYRKIELFSLFDGQILPALGLGNYLAAQPTATLQVLPAKLILDGICIPIDPNGSAILRYRGPSGTFKTYSAAAVIQSEIQFLNGETPNISDPLEFKDKYVFFGLSAPGLYDLRSAPVAGKFPGAEIYATMLDNFLSGDFIQKTPRALSIALVFFLAMGCALSAIYFSKPSGSLIVSAIAVPLPVLICLGAYSLGYWLPLVVQQSAVMVTIGIVLIVNYATEGRQRRFIKNAFKHFLSPDVIEQIIAHPERLKLGGERKVLSIFFSDLQGFTSISEGMQPESLTELLNDYLTEMSDIIHEEGGTIDKYEGDAIVAFWNAPLDVDEHAVRAAHAALRSQARLAALQPKFKQRINKDLRMRIGIHTGPVVVGNMGSRARFDYTILGDAVNLASRLEGANKQFGTYTMISHASRELLHDEFAVRELARLTVLGRREPVIVYEPMFHEEYEDKKEVMETFRQGLSLFYNGQFGHALETFSAIHKFDAPAAAYAAKCRTLMETQPVDWQGVWVMDTK